MHHLSYRAWCVFLKEKSREPVLSPVFLDIINIIAVTTFGVMHHEGFTYGQAFWMTMCSTVVSFLTNITLIVDLVRTPNFSKSGK